ncbi:hypothetical protein D3C86_2220330 [compost metagenome]
MSYHVLRHKLGKGDAFDFLEDFLCLYQAAFLVTLQINLRHVTGNHGFGAKPNPG